MQRSRAARPTRAHRTPVVGALLQEGIDLLVIGNALRALGRGGLAKPSGAEPRALARELMASHRRLRPRVDELAALAARLDTLPPGRAQRELWSTSRWLTEEILPHEQREQRTAYPLIGRLLPGEDPTGPLIQTHHEIRRLVRLFSRLVSRIPPSGPDREERAPQPVDHNSGVNTLRFLSVPSAAT